ncbi:pilus assembly protein [Methyloversatilis discipulorum]|uniref:pilus assembly protein n=1 Tax=Methyloversatilis discipulorum TaxID=1119528 RepID=UPI0003A9DCE1|nr:PilC/PilY family type IV pilus protein [Methyloversatilis discipulorum]
MSAIPSRFGWRKRALSTALLAAFASAPAIAQTEISNLPLVLNVTAAPNVMMILDNSGSMLYETLPDYFRDIWDFELAMRNTGSTSVYMPDYDDLNIFNLALRSSSLNRIYYNPNVTYRTWTNADGTGYAQSSPTAAPIRPGSTTTIDLTTEKTHTFRWRTNTSVTTFSASSSAVPRTFSCPDGPDGNTQPDDTCAQTYAPMTFFVHKGTGSIYERANYYRYRIVGAAATRKDMADGTETAVTSFSWAGGITRTLDQEKQNFANWYTYNRSRINAAKGGVSYAFSTLGQNYRVGFRTINGTTGWLDIPTNGTFSDTNRSNFFTSLFDAVADGNTPLRISLWNAGAYFKTADPWGPNVGGAPLSCRQSFAILTTDGYYNDNSTVYSTAGNADGTKGRPYADTQSVTLADIAMYYYDTDLQPDIEDNVPTTPEDGNNRQHMNTFGVSFGLTGSLNTATDLPRLTSGEISWPSISTDAGKLDDLWHATINGRGQFVNAGDPQEFADGLKGALDSIVARTASSSNLGVSSAQLRQGSRVFQARFTSEVWTGDIFSFLIGSDGEIPIVPEWRASERVPTPANRNIYTRNGSTAVPFVWDQLSDAQKATLGNNSAVLDYLRGVRSGESSEGGTFRNRSSLIGDIVHSSPVYVAAPDDFAYERFSWPGASTYQTHRTLRSDRTPMLYVAANDGMLHGFVASTGAERFAYVPSSSLAQMYQLTRPSYTHQFINDGALTVADVYDAGTANAWRTLLVGSTGRGGRQLYALDVSDPTIPADNPAGRRVMWEFSDADFGKFTGRPVVGRMNNGDWAVLVGNGYNSNEYKGFLFVVNATTGALIQKIDTGACPETDDPCVSNGLAEVTTWDEDSDGDIDYVYAGDLRGNLWRFDVTSSTPSQWKVSFGTDTSPLPLFRARNASGTPQPITSKVEVLLDPSTGTRWVSFGTGQFLGDTDRASTALQTWYGLYDNYPNAATSPVSGRSDLAQRVVLVETEQTTTTETENAEGETETTSETVKVRVISAQGDTTGGDRVIDADGTYIRKGWYLDLVPPTGTAAGERMIYGVQAFGGALFATSAIPADDPCTPGGSGWLMAIDPYTGGRLDADLFANRTQVTVTTGDSSTNYYVSAVSTGSMPSSPILVRNEGGSGNQSGGSTGGTTVGRSDALVNTSDLGILRERLNLPDRFGRISWRELIAD